jgi:hypothetical protein
MDSPDEHPPRQCDCLEYHVTAARLGILPLKQKALMGGRLCVPPLLSTRALPPRGTDVPTSSI